MSTKKPANPYIFPRRHAAEYSAGSPIPITPILVFLGSVAAHMRDEKIPGVFTPEKLLRFPVLAATDVRAARQTVDLGMLDKTLGIRIYSALPSTREDVLNAAFVSAEVVGGRVLRATVDDGDGRLRAERIAARNELCKIAGVELDLPPIDQSDITLGQFGEGAPEYFRSKVEAVTNGMLDGLSFNFQPVEYGFKSIIGK